MAGPEPDPPPSDGDAGPTLRQICVSASALLLVGGYTLVRNDSTLQRVLGLVMLLAALGLAVVAVNADTPPDE